MENLRGWVAWIGLMVGTVGCVAFFFWMLIWSVTQ